MPVYYCVVTVFMPVLTVIWVITVFFCFPWVYKNFRHEKSVRFLTHVLQCLRHDINSSNNCTDFVSHSKMTSFNIAAKILSIFLGENSMLNGLSFGDAYRQCVLILSFLCRVEWVERKCRWVKLSTEMIHGRRRKLDTVRRKPRNL